MTGRAFLIIGLLAWAPCAAAGPVAEQLTVSPGGLLEVDLETGASVEIRGWSRSELAVEGTFDDAVLLEATSTPQGARITSRFASGRGRTAGSRGHLTIRLPDRFDLELSNAAGGIEIEGLTGRIVGKTLGGRLALVRVGGTLDLETMGGEIELTDSRVGGRLETMGGNVHLRNVVGTVRASTMGGNVIYDNVTPVADGPGGGGVRVETMGGDIEVPNAPFGADVETMGGNIVIGAASGEIQASTMGGNIRIDAVDGAVRATTMGGDVKVTVVGDDGAGSHEVRLVSAGGDVELIVPPGLDMDVDVTLMTTRRGRRDHAIVSDFPLEIRESDGWDYSTDPPRRYVYGAGTTGNGRHKIKLEATNGDVRLLAGR